MKDLAICLLTGNRVNLLKQSIASLHHNLMEILHDCYFTIHINSNDKKTLEYIKCLNFVDDYTITKNGITSIGYGTSIVCMRAAKRKGIKYIMNIQDDWIIDGWYSNRQWLYDAINLLDSNKNVGQIRLILRKRKQSDKNYVTGKQINWQQRNDQHLFSSNAHSHIAMTLVRPELIHETFPIKNEKDLMKKYHKLNKDVIQHNPGVFEHIGDGRNSLKNKIIHRIKKQGLKIIEYSNRNR